LKDGGRTKHISQLTEEVFEVLGKLVFG